MVLESLDNQPDSVNNQQQFTVHPTVIADTPAVSTILARSFYKFPEFAGWVYPFLQLTINEDLRYRLRSRSPNHRSFVAKIAAHHHRNQEPNQESNLNSEQTSVVVGTIEIGLRSPSLWSTNVQYPYISNLAVHQDYRRQGLGSLLLQKCEEACLEWGYREARLHVLDSNNSAKQLYCHNGYQIAQIETNWASWWFDYSPRLLLKKQIQAH